MILFETHKFNDIEVSLNRTFYSNEEEGNGVHMYLES